MTEGWVRHRQGQFTLEVRWTVRAGEILTLYGPSGAGKSTTLRAIAGLVRPVEGRIVIGDQTVFDSSHSLWLPPHRRRVGYLPQHYGLFPHLTVERNVAFGLGRRGDEEASRRTWELLSMLQIEELADRYPADLSAGQQQRVALARALAPQPALLLLDEPFSALDQDLRRDLRRELKAVRDRTGVPIVLVSHDPADALALSDRVVALDGGRVVAEGSPVEVLERPASERLSRLMEVENVLEGRVVEVAEADGTMTCDLGGVLLVAPYAPLEVDEQVRIGLRAGDILVAVERPEGLSAQNALRGTVRSVQRRGFEAEVSVDCGRLFRAEVTPRSVERLGLAPGKMVWLVIKSNSCFLIE